MGTLLHSCADVHTAIELSFGMVSGVGVYVLDGVHMPPGEGAVSGMVSAIFGRPYYRSSLWYSMSSVCPSVRLSVMFCIVAKRCVLAKNCLKE